MEVYKINDEIEINELDNELIIILPQTDKMFFCNKIAKEIIFGLRDGLNVEQIVIFLLSRYEVDRATIEEDIQKTIESLLRYKILVSGE